MNENENKSQSTGQEAAAKALLPDKNKLPETKEALPAQDKIASTDGSAPSENAAVTDAPSSTKTTEIHHHTHVHHERKWKEYLFEFFMLFLAVFCGFFAEYQLEHRIEKEREKVLITSFYEDLTADQRDLQTLVANLNRQITLSDSLIFLLTHAGINKPANVIYAYLRLITRTSATNPYVNDRTIVQLRNSGGMRLIQNKAVSDSIVGYYKDVDAIEFMNNESVNMKRSLREILPLLLDGQAYIKTMESSDTFIDLPQPLYLRSSDALAINQCLIEVLHIKSLSIALRIRIEELKARGTEIKKYIAGEYGL